MNTFIKGPASRRGANASRGGQRDKEKEENDTEQLPLV